MVTLCPTTYESAQKMRNFSEWVRIQLSYRSQGYEIDEMIREIDHYTQLLSAISNGKKVWKEGYGWVDVE